MKKVCELMKFRAWTSIGENLQMNENDNDLRGSTGMQHADKLNKLSISRLVAKQ